MGAARAMATMTTTMTRPATARPLRLSLAQALVRRGSFTGSRGVVSVARRHQRRRSRGSRATWIRSVDEVDQHEAGGHHQHAALDQQDVAGRDGGDQHPADAGPLEDGLDVDGTAQDEAGLDADDRHDVDQRVHEGVAVDDPALAQALGAGGPHVVLAQHLEHVGAGQPGDHARGDDGERQGRQRQVPEQLARLPSPKSAYMPPVGNQPRPTENHKISMMPRKKDGVEMPTSTVSVISLSAQPYWRTAETTPARRPKMVQRRRAAPARIEGRAEALQHLVEHRPVERVGAAEIALEHAGEPGHVLHRQRLVEAELAVDPLDVLGRREGAQDCRRRVARDQRDHQKDDHRDPEQHRHGQEQPAKGVAEHGQI